MATEQKFNIYDGNSTFQESTQNIKDTDPNIINNLNKNIEQINNNDINVIKLDSVNNNTNNNTNNKNNIICKSVNILQSNKITDDILNKEEYPYYDNLRTTNKKAKTERNSDNILVKTITENKNINQPQKNMINTKAESIDNAESNKEKEDCCERCKDYFDCYCSEDCKKIGYVILIILSILTCLFLLIFLSINCLECFELCANLKNCDCSCCICRCCCCKKKQKETNQHQTH